MYILLPIIIGIIFSLDEPNLTRPESFRDKENLVKYKGKRTSREYTFIFFLFPNAVQAGSLCYFLFAE